MSAGPVVEERAAPLPRLRPARRLRLPLARLIATLLLAVLVLYPVGRLAWESAHLHGVWTTAAYRAVLREPATRAALVHTLVSSAIATLAAAVAGTAIGWLLARTDLPFRGTAATLLLFPLVLPPFVHALAWLQAYGPVGVVPSSIAALAGGHAHPRLFLGAGGVITLLAFQGLPVAGLLVVSALARIDPAGEEAARAAGAGPLRAFAGVTLPALLPAIAAAAGIVFVASVSDFGVPAVVGLPAGYGTITTRIYAYLTFSSSASSFTRAIALSALLGAGAAVALALLALRREPTGGFGGRPPQSAPAVALGRWRKPAAVLLALLFLLVVVLPLIALVLTALTRVVGDPPLPGNLTLANARRVLHLPQAGQALRTSLWLATLAATIALALGLLVALTTRRPGPFARVLPALATLPFGMPGSVTAVAFILAWGQKLPLVGRSLYGTAWLILLAYIARFLVFAVEPLRAALSRLDPALEEAAAIAGARRARRLRDVLVPQLLPALLAGWLLIFLTALHELTVSALLAAPGVTTLGVAVLNFEQEGDYTAMAALATLLVILVGVGLAALALAHRFLARGR